MTSIGKHWALPPPTGPKLSARDSSWPWQTNSYARAGFSRRTNNRQQSKRGRQRGRPTRHSQWYGVRSEERRVGKESRSRWAAEVCKKRERRGRRRGGERRGRGRRY